MHRGYLPYLAAVAQVTGSLARTVTYNWNVTWVFANPDGFERPVIGINGAWPCPTIEATVGDIVVVNLNNQLGNETTGLHFHGINQVSSNDMDGAVGTNQCPLPPDYSVKYRFYVSDTPCTIRGKEMKLTTDAKGRRTWHILV
ncbi:Cupredoxin [Annulohypoxylon truncatum]|uniref:Cupredoxin n=1 Tax=Annulohypoxylon truncatum TaxID=327061 RepID=UPI0020089953|nr:Cupredoxin [Annulohypoxylon truncatum]KAI1207279.1 Cupredoxin [Annulohypoxylon truncatum]